MASPDAPTPSPQLSRPFVSSLKTILPALLLGVLAGVLCYLAAGTSLGLWFGGVLLATLIVPPLAAGEKRIMPSILATLATVTGIAGVWLFCVLREGTASDTHLTDWFGCTCVLFAYALALAGIVRALLRLRAAPAPASTVALLLGLAWLTWPIWLSTALAGHDRITVVLAGAHPLLAINAALRHLGLWQQQHLAYTLTNLNQDVALPLPGSLLPAIAAHALLGAALIAAAMFRRRRGTSPAPLTASANAVAPLPLILFLALIATATHAARAAPEVTTTAPASSKTLVDRGNFPHRIHVFEDYETLIERRWWLRGTPEEKNLPDTGGSTRAFRGGETKDFDDLMGDRTVTYTAVVFNPVPGPPMGKNTRLAFRYWLKGTDRLRVQIYSLTNGYHRMVVLKDLPQERWISATVDMTQLRRPDGSGGPLSEDERIDDIQFYVERTAEVIVDDIVLYDAGVEGETEPFPARVIFTGWFDTGRQGKIGTDCEWPGDFEIVKHDPPLTWKAARSVIDEAAKKPWLRIGLRGPRPLPANVRLRLRYRITGADAIDVRLVDTKSGSERHATLKRADPARDEWTQATLELPRAAEHHVDDDAADELRFLLPAGAMLMVDDVVLYQPGT